MDQETDHYGKTPAQQFAEAIQNIFDAYEEDIEEEGGTIEKTGNGIIYQYPTAHKFQILVIDLTITSKEG